MKIVRFPQNEHEERIRKIQQQVAMDIIERENILNAIEIGYDPRECQECHLPGDCPLCGAK